jgi:hypothetical protein
VTDPRVLSICEEYGVRVIAGNRYPDVGETRAVSTLNRILQKHGEAHFRMVMTTASETANNKASLEANFLWATSDLVIDCARMIEADASRFLSVFDQAPIDQMLWIIRGKRQQRYLLQGMLLERIIAEYQDQPSLFDRRAA